MKVGLFIPCYINAVYPQVGVASFKLLKSLGVDVDYPFDGLVADSPWRMRGLKMKPLNWRGVLTSCLRSMIIL